MISAQTIPLQSSDISPEADNFDKLYKQYLKTVYRQCLSFTKDAIEAEDFTHDIFLKVFTGLPQFKEQASLSTWLYAITRNYCLDQAKLNSRRENCRLTENLDWPELETEEEKELQLQRLHQIIASLPPQEAKLLELKYEEQVSIEKLAEQFNLSKSAVKMRLKRSREKIISLYQKQYGIGLSEK